jgi:hypothetical protein
MAAVRERELERWIDQKMNGRIHRLSVQTEGDQVIVHGCTSTHCARQLALAAALDAVQSRYLNLDISVGM